MTQPLWGRFTEPQRSEAKVDELLRWCDTLEAQLHQTRTLGAHLLDATLHQILSDDGQGET